MTDTDIARRLLETASDPASSRVPDPAFELILAEERRFEERVRKLALRSWAATFACLFVVCAAAVMLPEGDGAWVHGARFALLFCSFAGALSLFAGCLTSLTWLFRSRRSTLKAIERRLADLEAKLRFDSQ